MSAPTVYAQLREKALQFSPEERVDFAHDLLDSVVPEDELDDKVAVETEWEDEIERRVEELDAGFVETVPAAEAFARARERVRQFAGVHAGKLTVQERVELAQELLESVEVEGEDDAAVEIKRRVDEIRAGTAVTYDAEEVLAELRARYG